MGSTAWAYDAKIGNGVIRTVEERTRRNGKLRAKFKDSAECWTVAFDENLTDGGVVRCQVILPKEWNGRLWLVANDGMAGELPERAVAFAKDGSAVVCGDGGMGQVRRRNGRVNAIAAGARDKALRKAFFQESLAVTLQGGKALVEGRYERPADQVFCFGRETGGARALSLVTENPSAVNGLFLVNPVVDFAACAAYDLNIARQMSVSMGHGRLLRPSQFDALRRAAGELPPTALDTTKTNALWATASKYDDSFMYEVSAVRKICDAWQALLQGGEIRDGGKAVPIPPVRLDMDFESRMLERSWRLAWLFGEDETGADVTDAAFISRIGEMAAYAPKMDLKPYLEAGGKVVLVEETANPRVPAQIADPLAHVVKDVRRVTLLEEDVKEAATAFADRSE